MSDPKLTSSDVIRDYLSRLNNHSNVNPDFSSESEDVSSCVVLSVICLGSKIGAAYFDFDQEHLHLMPDRSLTPPSYTFLHLLLKQAEPTYIITSCKTDQNVLGILKEHICPSTITSSTILRQKTDERLHLLPNLDFALEACKHRLQKLQLPGLPENMNEQERKIHFSTLVDFTSICMVKAAGGLLKFIENNHFSKNLDSNTPLVMTVSNLSLKNILNMDEISYRSLQIFQEERHPSVYKSTFGTKEGLSLYGICNKCKSAIGKKELRRWFLFPSSDLSLIKERQEGIKFFLSERNMELKHMLQQSLKNIKFIPRVLLRMKTAQATLTDWQSLLKTAYHGMLIGNICHSKTSELKIFEQIDSSFSNDLFRISSLLDKIIDFEEYLKQNHFVVKHGVDDELDKMKRTYHGLPDFMTQIAYKELQDLSADIENCTVIYLPQMGYLLAIPLTKQMKDTKDYHLPNLKYMFIVNDVAHYKSINTRELDSVLGDTLCDIYVS